MPKISPLAVVDPNARLAEDVEVGPFCVIGPDVQIGAGCRLLNSVTILGITTIGKDNIFHPNAVIGNEPQDKKYRGGRTALMIGDRNQIREAVTIHTGTELGGGITRIGNDNLLMVNCHIGHDANIGSHNILANNIMLAGHIVIGNYVAMMGGAGVHHFVTIGDYVYIGGYSKIHHDVPPFVKVDGSDQIRGVNSIGLKRAGFSDTDIAAIEFACRELFYRENGKNFAATLHELEQQPDCNPHVRKMIDFLHQRDLGRQGRYRESLRKE